MTAPGSGGAAASKPSSRAPAPSTGWRERVGDDEARRHEEYARLFERLQQAKSRRFGNGRALHRKQVLALRARLEVPAGLPAHARHGLFAAPGAHDAWIRLSNGGTDRAPDRRPDVRGFAIKVLGVDGPGALDGARTDCQDFLLINHEAFAFPDSRDFVGLVSAAAGGPLALIGWLARRYGPIGALGRVAHLRRVFGRPFAGFAASAFHSAAPIACGPYAARVRLVPAPANGPASRGADWKADVAGRLAKAPLQYELQLQFFVDEAATPIEDASVNWPQDVAPYVTVGRLTIAAAADDPEFERRIEDAVFDPWRALAQHRPLGEVMRARRAVYYASQRTRGAAGG